MCLLSQTHTELSPFASLSVCVSPVCLQEALQSFLEEQDYPDSLLYHFPSQLRLEALPELVDCSVSRSLLTSLLTALKANGERERKGERKKGFTFQFHTVLP